MDAATTARLQAGAAGLGVPLDDDQLARFARYLQLLLSWNRKINLTAITEPTDVVDRHFLDSLSVAPLLTGLQTLVDVGSGAGFPGVALAVALPSLRVTCVESIRKKTAFLETLRVELAPHLEVLCSRAEALGPRTFDAAVSRATWDPSEWLAHGAPLVSPGGLLIAMQTADSQDLHSPPGFVTLPPHPYKISNIPRRLQAFRRGRSSEVHFSPDSPL